MMENIEREVQELSNGKCVICHKISNKCYVLDENKTIEKENLIVLCTKCANQYIGNLELVNQLKQKRDYWYRQIKEAIEKTGSTDALILNQEKEDDNSAGIAIYHVIYEDEGFYEAAKDLFELLKSSQEKMENKKRYLYLDIDGHMDSFGRFDKDMSELLQNYIIEALLPYFYEIHTPLLDVRNSNPQRNDIPDNCTILNTENEIVDFLKEQINEGGYILEKVKKQYLDNTKKFIYKRK